ncbi:MAG: hypothetical protein EOO47_01180 [Flavobacterium sp.]|nr:MAG: hypothetical protein EOO47_01180 [Flavobacterium sp.]
MKTFEFKQNDLKRGVPFAIIYLGAVLTACYLYFGGFLGMANALENFKSGKALGLLVGLCVLGPFIVILTLLMPKVKVEVGSNAITISSNKNQKQISYTEIYALRLNMTNLNRLDILDQQNNVLTYIQPQNKPEFLAQIIKEVANHVVFTKQVGSKKYFTSTIETAFYIRKVQ